MPSLMDARLTPIEPTWLRVARHHIGLREIPGLGSNPRIDSWQDRLNAGWLDGDNAAWCGVFAGGCLLSQGIEPPERAYRAREWATWGQDCGRPVVGAVGVQSFAGGKGHVTFVVGRTLSGRLLGLGGNQDDQVKISSFAPDAFETFRYPPDDEIPQGPLPVYANEQAASSYM